MFTNFCHAPPWKRFQRRLCTSDSGFESDVSVSSFTPESEPETNNSISITASQLYKVDLSTILVPATSKIWLFRLFVWNNVKYQHYCKSTSLQNNILVCYLHRSIKQLKNVTVCQPRQPGPYLCRWNGNQIRRLYAVRSLTMIRMLFQESQESCLTEKILKTVIQV